jgi:hypothetical protein
MVSKILLLRNLSIRVEQPNVKKSGVLIGGQ